MCIQQKLLLRGQILRDDNSFPTATEINNISLGKGIVISWDEAADPNGDLVVYTLQASLEEKEDAKSLFRTLVKEFIKAKREKRKAELNVRVLSSDGSVSAIGEVFEQNIDRKFLRSLLLGKFEQEKKRK